MDKFDWDQLADELHKPIRRKFEKRRVIITGKSTGSSIDNTWTADLIDMQPYSRWNKGYKYLLTVLDVFSKYAWVVPVRDKKGKTITSAFSGIINKSKRKPAYLWVDKGNEFYNSTFKDYLKENRIILYSTQNVEKSSVIERFNRTLKNKMFKEFTVQNSTVYTDILPKIVDEYNRTYHKTVKITPEEASLKKNESVAYLKSYHSEPSEEFKKPYFKIRDKVRISKYRGIFDKSYKGNWSEEIFIINKIQPTIPITYKIKDLLGEDIKGYFYKQELQKVDQEIFRIEKVLKKYYKNKRMFVKWKGYPDKFNSWEPLELRSSAKSLWLEPLIKIYSLY